jgi:hypothetical protein
MFDQEDERTLLEKVEKLQRGLVANATQDAGHLDIADFMRLREEIISDSRVQGKVPDIIRKYRELGQFWQFIKHKFPTYRERREYIWQEIRPLIEYLEVLDRSPGVQPITEALVNFDSQYVYDAWQKALDRRVRDPEGAITAARMLLESVCKHILDESGKPYDNDIDLPKLWALTAENLNLAPHQHEEKVFKSILGNCQSIVNNLGAIRNKIGDAHGQGKLAIKPKPRHAELAVNLAGTMASFLVSTWDARSARSAAPGP